MLENQSGVISFHTRRKTQLKNVIWDRKRKQALPMIELAREATKMFQDMIRNSGNGISERFYRKPNRRYLLYHISLLLAYPNFYQSASRIPGPWPELSITLLMAVTTMDSASTPQSITWGLPGFAPEFLALRPSSFVLPVTRFTEDMK